MVYVFGQMLVQPNAVAAALTPLRHGRHRFGSHGHDADAIRRAWRVRGQLRVLAVSHRADANTFLQQYNLSYAVGLRALQILF